MTSFLAFFCSGAGARPVFGRLQAELGRGWFILSRSPVSTRCRFCVTSATEPCHPHRLFQPEPVAQSKAQQKQQHKADHGLHSGHHLQRKWQAVDDLWLEMDALKSEEPKDIGKRQTRSGPARHAPPTPQRASPKRPCRNYPHNGLPNAIAIFNTAIKGIERAFPPSRDPRSVGHLAAKKEMRRLGQPLRRHVLPQMGAALRGLFVGLRFVFQKSITLFFALFGILSGTGFLLARFGSEIILSRNIGFGMQQSPFKIGIGALKFCLSKVAGRVKTGVREIRAT